MAKKADLQTAYERYTALCTQAARLDATDPAAVVARAEQALPDLKDALNYHRRFIKTGPPPLAAVDRILRLAPPLFARPALVALAAHLDGWSKAERAAVPDLPDRVAAAWRCLAVALRLWGELNATPDGHRPAGRDEPDAAGVVPVWVAAGWVVAVGVRGYALATDLRREGWGKCPACGGRRRAALNDLLSPLACVVCEAVEAFVLLPNLPAKGA